ncbi:hypothetical protein VNO78_03550 [Psophocarpus tetragonolobus]|uniref:Uncharacterized protein n=1 Tax=Psophocarpus tetragonolobus TaxID=3891 RepID=A0AAN9T1Q2_PSOTE
MAIVATKDDVAADQIHRLSPNQTHPKRRCPILLLLVESSFAFEFHFTVIYHLAFFIEYKSFFSDALSRNTSPCCCCCYFYRCSTTEPLHLQVAFRLHEVLKDG